MDINAKNMVNSEFRKVAKILTKLSTMDWDLGGYGQADVNKNSGNVYVWLEDYPVTPYIGLGSDTVKFLFACPNCGNEWDISTKRVKAQDFPCSCGKCDWKQD